MYNITTYNIIFIYYDSRSAELNFASYHSFIQSGRAKGVKKFAAICATYQASFKYCKRCTGHLPVRILNVFTRLYTTSHVYLSALCLLASMTCRCVRSPVARDTNAGEKARTKYLYHCVQKVKPRSTSLPCLGGKMSSQALCILTSSFSDTRAQNKAVHSKTSPIQALHVNPCAD